MEALILEHASPVLRDVITIMLNCGMRPEEVGCMEWEHVRWDENVVLVPHGKSFKARRFEGLTKRMRETLATAPQWKERKRGFPVCVPDAGQERSHGELLEDMGADDWALQQSAQAAW
jgi:integrase